MSRQRFRASLGSLFTLAILIGLWWAVCRTGWISRVFLPSPGTALDSLVQGLSQGPLVAFTLATAGRMAVGWLLACALGLLLGALIGSSPGARAWLQPTLEFLRPMPASALLPLAIAVFGLTPGMVLFVVALGAMWPVLLSTVHGLAATHERLKEVGQALQLGRLEFLLKIGLPNALADALAGMRLALTVSLIVSVVGEMVASQDGLGQAVLMAARSFQSGDLFAGVILLGLVGLLSNALLGAVERRVLRWQRP
jgi:sulfonate transport system permease protein